MKFVILGIEFLTALIILRVCGTTAAVTGFLWGIVIAQAESVLVATFFERLSASSLPEVFRRYLLGALIRIPLLIGMFACVVFVIGINRPPASWGLLVGIGIGFAIAGVLSFKKVGTVASNQTGKSD